ncbi:MAG: hypothetical protein ACKOED_02790 [Aestuariivirga sp.]|uniref:hypothetical protein n=1 Tax=Aestuariivirga sp. TaxID=2650926 RepID=UPI0038CF6E9B
MIRGLPPIDVPFHLQEPDSCARCVHSFHSADDKAHRYLRCRLSDHAEQCRYERHETGNCGPAATYWKDRGA